MLNVSILGGLQMDEKIVQSLLLENKEVLNVTGVENVDNFNDEIVVLITNKGKLTIKGEKLNISKLNVDEGKLIVKGVISSLVYSDYEGQREKVSLVKKLFK
jgi:sporulation protein YabP